MPATIKVPTIFSAIDKFTSPVARMGIAVTKFADKAQAGIARGNRWFRKLTPTLSSASQELFSFAKSAAIAGALVGGVVFSYQSIKDYETAVASFRTIVSDLDNNAFKPYQQSINQVAKDTKASSIDVAKSFETIAGLNSKFAETADGLGLVSKASIILSQASGQDLQTSAENLVGIMNQFSLGAGQANRVINVLAAGQAVGAASISEAAESYKNFGAVAKGSNITLEQSVALIETLAAKQIKGAEAGTALRGVVLKLQKAGMGYKSGQFQINDALTQTSRKLSHLKTAKEKDAFITKLFGAENITAGKVLLDNINTYKEFTKSVTGTNEAQKAASINTDTLTVKWNQLKNKWVNFITSNDNAGKGLTITKNAIGFITDNLDTLIGIGGYVLGFFVGFKALLIGCEIAMGLYSVALGVVGAVSGVASVSIGSNAIAMKAYTVATWLGTAASTAFAFAVNLGLWPILLIVAGIAAIIAIIYNWDAVVKWFGEQWGKFTNWISEAWNSIVSTFQNFSFTEMFMQIGKSIVDFFLLPLRAVLALASKIPGAIGNGAASALANLDNLTANMVVSDERNNKPALGTPAQKQQQVNSENFSYGNLAIDINDPGNNVKSTNTSGSLVSTVKVGSTQGRK
jgi:TP901 family phage tail tape measure protein